MIILKRMAKKVQNMQEYNQQHYSKFKEYSKDCFKTEDNGITTNIEDWWEHVTGKINGRFPSPENKKITRQILKDICNKNSKYTDKECLASIMAWGGQNRKHGKLLFEKTAFLNKVLSIISDMRNEQLTPIQAYDKFYNLRQQKEIPGMGVAYFTKLIFFCESSHTGYIMDQWTSKSVNLLHDKEIVKFSGNWVTDINNSNVYANFCNITNDIASSLNVSAEKVEIAMFSKGGHKKADWRKYLIKNYKNNGFSHAIEKLKWVMACLRDPDKGCPWDKEQDFKSIIKYTIEEAYEVADAIENGDMDELKEELGDLLLQVIYYTQMATEENLFNFDDVAKGVADKMISRHPHVFGDSDAQSASDVMVIWEQQKDKEKQSKGALGGVTKGLPALLRAQKLQKKAAKVGYEWPDSAGAFTKLEEEIIEFKEATTPDHKEEEFGDLLFCLVNYGRMQGLDAEEALRKANKKFIKRFEGMEADCAKDNIEFSTLSLNQMLELWEKQKKK